MADDDRPPVRDLTEPSTGLEAYELLRRLERGGRRFGGAGGPDCEPARIGQSIRLGFATEDLAAFRPSGADAPARVTLHGIGLMGPEGPLPLHLTRRVLDRLAQRWFAGGAEGATADTTFLDFANLLQHRLLALHWRASSDTRPEIEGERPGPGPLGALAGALAGLGLRGSDDPDHPALDRLRRDQATALCHPVIHPERVTGFLSAALAVPVRLVEFVGHWMPVPGRLQTRLGRAHAGLGRGATLGPRSFDRQSRIEIVLGPLPFRDFERFLPGGDRLGVLRAALRPVLGSAFEAMLRLVLSRDEVPAARIGSARLGRDAWIAPRGDMDAEYRHALPIAGHGEAAR